MAFKKLAERTETFVSDEDSSQCILCKNFYSDTEMRYLYSTLVTRGHPDGLTLVHALGPQILAFSPVEKKYCLSCLHACERVSKIKRKIEDRKSRETLTRQSPSKKKKRKRKASSQVTFPETKAKKSCTGKDSAESQAGLPEMENVVDVKIEPGDEMHVVTQDNTEGLRESYKSEELRYEVQINPDFLVKEEPESKSQPELPRDSLTETSIADVKKEPGLEIQTHMNGDNAAKRLSTGEVKDQLECQGQVTVSLTESIPNCSSSEGKIQLENEIQRQISGVNVTSKVPLLHFTPSSCEAQGNTFLENQMQNQMSVNMTPFYTLKESNLMTSEGSTVPVNQISGINFFNTIPSVRLIGSNTLPGNQTIGANSVNRMPSVRLIGTQSAPGNQISGVNSVNGMPSVRLIGTQSGNQISGVNLINSMPLLQIVPTSSCIAEGKAVPGNQVLVGQLTHTTSTLPENQMQSAVSTVNSVTNKRLFRLIPLSSYIAEKKTVPGNQVSVGQLTHTTSTLPENQMQSAVSTVNSVYNKRLLRLIQTSSVTVNKKTLPLNQMQHVISNVNLSGNGQMSEIKAGSVTADKNKLPENKMQSQVPGINLAHMMTKIPAKQPTSHEGNNLPANQVEMQTSSQNQVQQPTPSVNASSQNQVQQPKPFGNASGQNQVQQPKSFVNASSQNQTEQPTPCVNASGQIKVQQPKSFVNASSQNQVQQPTPCVNASGQIQVQQPKSFVNASSQNQVQQPTPCVNAFGQIKVQQPKSFVNASSQNQVQQPRPCVTASGQIKVQQPKSFVNDSSQKQVQQPQSGDNAASQKQVQLPPSCDSASSQKQVLQPTPSVNASSQIKVQQPTPSVYVSSQTQVQQPPPSVNASSQKQVLQPTPTVNASRQKQVQQPTPSVNVSSQTQVQQPTPSVNALSQRQVQQPPASVNAPSRKQVQQPPSGDNGSRQKQVQQPTPSVNISRQKQVQQPQSGFNYEKQGSQQKESLKKVTPDEEKDKLDLNKRHSSEKELQVLCSKLNCKRVKTDPHIMFSPGTLLLQDTCFSSCDQDTHEEYIHRLLHCLNFDNIVSVILMKKQVRNYIEEKILIEIDHACERICTKDDELGLLLKNDLGSSGKMDTNIFDKVFLAMQKTIPFLTRVLKVMCLNPMFKPSSKYVLVMMFAMGMHVRNPNMSYLQQLNTCLTDEYASAEVLNLFSKFSFTLDSDAKDKFFKRMKKLRPGLLDNMTEGNESVDSGDVSENGKNSQNACLFEDIFPAVGDENKKDFILFMNAVPACLDFNGIAKLAFETKEIKNRIECVFVSGIEGSCEILCTKSIPGRKDSVFRDDLAAQDKIQTDLFEKIEQEVMERNPFLYKVLKTMCTVRPTTSCTLAMILAMGLQTRRKKMSYLQQLNTFLVSQDGSLRLLNMLNKLHFTLNSLAKQQLVTQKRGVKALFLEDTGEGETKVSKVQSSHSLFPATSDRNTNKCNTEKKNDEVQTTHNIEENMEESSNKTEKRTNNVVQTTCNTKENMEKSSNETLTKTNAIDKKSSDIIRGDSEDCTSTSKEIVDATSDINSNTLQLDEDVGNRSVAEDQNRQTNPEKNTNMSKSHHLNPFVRIKAEERRAADNCLNAKQRLGKKKRARIKNLSATNPYYERAKVMAKEEFKAMMEEYKTMLLSVSTPANKTRPTRNEGSNYGDIHNGKTCRSSILIVEQYEKVLNSIDANDMDISTKHANKDIPLNKPHDRDGEQFERPPTAETSVPGTSDLRREPYSCKQCTYRTYHTVNLWRHIKSVHRGYLCTQYSCKYNLREHMSSRYGKTHHRSDTYAELLNRLRAQPRNYTRQKPLYRCGKCPKTFKMKKHFHDHLFFHKNIIPHKCSACKKSFRYKSKFTRHTITCTKKLKFQCPHCKSFLQSRYNLTEHIRSKHGQPSYICLCGQKYAWRTSLIRHQKKCKHVASNIDLSAGSHRMFVLLDVKAA